VFGDVAARAEDSGTKTPIKHIIVLIGENRTFDSVFATYNARHGQSIGNLVTAQLFYRCRVEQDTLFAVPADTGSGRRPQPAN
jgi:phospholipase C